ncbi:MAG: allophanate hydrolase, partial [Pontimonas sp.]|nr:allophanate hydrolase [Pontimonas sp.]
MAIEIMETGLATSIQDQGRVGYYNVGIPPSGALDLVSAAAANVLVGNDPSAAVIESAYMGPKLRFTEPSIVAVTGAQIPVLVNDQEMPLWESFAVQAGDVLSFGILQG